MRLVWLVVRALDFVTKLVLKLKVRSLDLEPIQEKIGWTHVLYGIGSPWRADDCFPEGTVAFDLHCY